MSTAEPATFALHTALLLRSERVAPQLGTARLVGDEPGSTATAFPSLELLHETATAGPPSAC